MNETANARGLVSLVGAGPGDPELITLKGLKRLRKATVVLYDRLAPEELLEEARGARRMNVGKQPGGEQIQQNEINQGLVSLAEKGHRVVRLKGGDPCIFGRGGEEAQALAEAGIPFEIVPGVTSAVGVPSAAGIPLTHRNLSGSVAILTGHRHLEAEQRLRWKELARGADTLVLLMSVSTLRRNCLRIRRAGRDGSTPAAAIQQGTTEHQNVITGTLKTLPNRAELQQLQPPATVVVGDVARLFHDLTRGSGFQSGRPNVAEPESGSAGTLHRINDQQTAYGS